MSEIRSIAYRRDIDGLRAVAVLAVVAYHASPSLLSGGYVGVDVFFVISGFLISTIILREMEAGSFSLAGFYARRIRRLFPALIVVLAATLAIGWYFLLPHEFRALGKHMAAGAAYFINFTLKREAGYFDAAADDKPLLHLWSLAIEEQFYVVWPLLLLLVRERRHLVVAVALITGVSFALQLEAVVRNPASAFFLPQNRVWELSAGALLAILALYAAEGRTAWIGERLTRAGVSIVLVSHIMSCAGLALILGSAFGLDQRVLYPGAWAGIPVTGAVLLIGAGPGAVVNRFVLAQKPLVFVGLISYSLYLWHWPLLSFRSILGLKDDWLVTGVAVALAFALAVLTYWFVEPLRRTQRPAMPAVLASIIALCAVVGFSSQREYLEPRLATARHHDLSEAVNDWRFPNGLERAYTSSGLRIFKSADARDRVLYVGDSHIEQYWPRVERRLSETHGQKSAIFATIGGCPPVPGVHEKTRPDCRNFAERALELAEQPAIGTVVIGAAWAGYFGNSTFYLEGKGGGRIMIGSPPWNRALSKLSQTISNLVARGKAVWLVLDTPVSATVEPTHSLRRSLSGDASFVPLQFDRAAFERLREPITTKLIEIARATGAHIIDPVGWICGPTICPGEMADGRLMYKDGSHLRAAYVRGHATFMDQTLYGSRPTAAAGAGSLAIETQW